MIRLSSNMTLVLKLFLPILWCTFFGLFAITMFVAEPEYLGIFGYPMYRYIYLACFFVFLLFLYFTVVQLYRIESDDEHIFVTNYLKTYRYHIEDIANVSEINLLIFTLVIFRLRNKGKFGKKLPFIAKSGNYHRFVTSNAEYLGTISAKA